MDIQELSWRQFASFCWRQKREPGQGKFCHHQSRGHSLTKKAEGHKGFFSGRDPIFDFTHPPDSLPILVRHRFRLRETLLVHKTGRRCVWERNRHKKNRGWEEPMNKESCFYSLLRPPCLDPRFHPCLYIVDPHVLDVLSVEGKRNMRDSPAALLFNRDARVAQLAI